MTSYLCALFALCAAVLWSLWYSTAQSSSSLDIERYRTASSEASRLTRGLEDYIAIHKSLPESIDGMIHELEAINDELVQGVESLDPWGRPWDIQYGRDKGQIVIGVVSSGADGKGNTQDDIIRWCLLPEGVAHALIKK